MDRIELVIIGAGKSIPHMLADGKEDRQSSIEALQYFLD